MFAVAFPDRLESSSRTPASFFDGAPRSHVGEEGRERERERWEMGPPRFGSSSSSSSSSSVHPSKETLISFDRVAVSITRCIPPPPPPAAACAGQEREGGELPLLVRTPSLFHLPKCISTSSSSLHVAVRDSPVDSPQVHLEQRGALRSVNPIR